MPHSITPPSLPASGDNRIAQFVRRWKASRSIGIRFRGIKRTVLPTSVRLFDQVIPLTIPEQCGISDIVNIWLDDEYGLLEMHSRPRTILDCGANIGLFSLWARHCYRDARIVSLEPNSRIYETCQSNLASCDVDLRMQAVGVKNGRANVLDGSDSRLASCAFSACGSVAVVSLRGILEELGDVDLVKLDIEGGEWPIIYHSDCLRMVPFVRMEYHLVDGYSTSALVARFEELGFQCKRLVANNGFGIAHFDRVVE